jgi:hypothetical protein
MSNKIQFDCNGLTRTERATTLVSRNMFLCPPFYKRMKLGEKTIPGLTYLFGKRASESELFNGQTGQKAGTVRAVGFGTEAL